MKRGFTLLELIIVIIIIGVLATLGITQYTRAIEKGRSAEAKSNLGAIRNQQVAYKQDKGVYAILDGADDQLGIEVSRGSGSSCTGDNSTKYYFQYECTGGASTVCRAYRCMQGGKTPNATTTYNISLDMETGVWGGTPGYY